MDRGIPLQLNLVLKAMVVALCYVDLSNLNPSFQCGADQLPLMIKVDTRRVVCLVKIDQKRFP